uniref:Innexin n=1 Tax=Meloidogyne incognita TaxID=6306 RepID=A0A914LHZ5_MELIC
MDNKLRQLISKVKKEYDDDSVDRCIYATTVYIVGFFAVLIMAKQYVGDPLQCWLPAEYTGAWESYIENYCFVENTYYIAQNQSSKLLSPENRQARRKYELRYYQWIPYILALQALLCFAPKMIFKILCSFSELKINDLAKIAYKETKKSLEYKNKSKRIAGHLIAHTNARAQTSNYYLTAIYLLMKFLMFLSILIQLILINLFLGTWDLFWGFNILWQIVVDGVDWRNNGFFPRVTFCDLQTRDIGQYREHTVQCVLMINMFAEKIFIFLWLWFFILLFILPLNISLWIYRIFSMKSNEEMIVDALKANFRKNYFLISPPPPFQLHDHFPTIQDVRKFIREFLKIDDIVILRMINSNVGYIQTSDILHQLWLNYNSIEDISEKQNE